MDQAIRDNLKRLGFIAMNAYPNLHPEQRRVQQLVDQFNKDERIQRSLEMKRYERRLRCPNVTCARRKVLELLDSVIARPLNDCIGFLEEQ